MLLHLACKTIIDIIQAMPSAFYYVLNVNLVFGSSSHFFSLLFFFSFLFFSMNSLLGIGPITFIGTAGIVTYLQGHGVTSSSMHCTNCNVAMDLKDAVI